MNHQWDQPNKPISLEEMDQLVTKFKEAKEEYAKRKKESNEAYEQFKLLESQVLRKMQESGKTDYSVSGVGRILVSNKMSVQTPKDRTSKEAMLSYFKSLGDDVFLHYVSVNSRSLNSHYNDRLEEDPSFVMPGVDLPTAMPSISLRKK